MRLPVCVTKTTSLIPPALRAEWQTARVGSDKSIGWHAINKSKDANKLGGSRCADLSAPRASDPSLLKQGTQIAHPQWEGRRERTFDKLRANTDYTVQQNYELNLEQFAWDFIARQCLLT